MPKTFCLLANKTKQMRKSEKQRKQTDFFKKSDMSALNNSTGEQLTVKHAREKKIPSSEREKCVLQFDVAPMSAASLIREKR